MAEIRTFALMPELVTRLQAGERSARDTIARLHAPLVQQWANHFHQQCPWVERDDLCSEGWVALLDALPRFQGLHGATVTTFVQQAIRRRMIDFIDRTPRWLHEPQQIEEKLAGAAERTDPSALREDIDAEMRRLPTLWREVLVLHYGLNGDRPFSFSRIARRLGVSRQRIGQLHQQAIMRIRNLLNR